MKKALSLMLMTSFILVGCETTGPFGDIPKRPGVETQRGRDCVRECDDQNARCLSSCESVRWDRKTRCRWAIHQAQEGFSYVPTLPTSHFGLGDLAIWQLVQSYVAAINDAIN